VSAKCLALFAGLALFAFQPARAELRRANDLGPSERAKLQASEQRLGIYDQALRYLDYQHSRHRVSRQDYAFQQRELVSFINAEAVYQNGLLTRTSTFPEESREVLENIAKYSIEIPGYIILFALRALGSSQVVIPAH
jgi:hypothetical protein